MAEITLTIYQAQIFNMVEGYFSSKGYLGEDLFEDTYVLQKRLADYITNNVSLNSGNDDSEIVANRVYNAVLNIQFDRPNAGGGVDDRINPNPTGNDNPTEESSTNRN